MRVLVIAVGLPFRPVSTTVWLVKKDAVGAEVLSRDVCEVVVGDDGGQLRRANVAVGGGGSACHVELGVDDAVRVEAQDGGPVEGVADLPEEGGARGVRVRGVG